MLPLFLRSERPNLPTVRIERGEVEIGLQRGNENQIAGDDGRGVNLAAHFLEPERLAVLADGVEVAGFGGEQEMIVLQDGVTRDGSIRLNAPVQSGIGCVEGIEIALQVPKV